MTYDFSAPVDLNEVKSVRVSPIFKVSIFDNSDQICDTTEICNRASFCDIQRDGVIKFFISITQQDPNLSLTGGNFITSTEYEILTIGTTDFTLVGAASNTVGLKFTATGPGSGTGTAGASWTVYQDLITGDYSARGIRFRVTGTVIDTSIGIKFDEISVNFDTVDLIQTGTVTTSAGADVTETFSTGFYGGSGGGGQKPVVGVQIVGGSAGDTVDIVTRSVTSFDISVYDSGGSRVVRSVDWMAIGQ
jgi:hypothetical protein